MESTQAAQPFNLFAELLARDELAYELSRHLDVEEFATLYSISRRFHRLVNAKVTTCLERNAATNAGESAAVFPWRLYRGVCGYDPMRNLLAPRAGRGARVRDVPTIRWLRMVYHREEAVASIVVELAEAGHRLPAGSALVLKKLWFLMDLPDTARRVGVVHNPRLWADRDLLLATLFFIKLDMRLTDPLDGRARPHVRRMLLAQRGLGPLACALERRALTDMDSFLRMFAEWRVRVPDGAAAETMFGLPAELCGRLGREGWTNRGDGGQLMPVDDLVMKEGIRRDLRLNRWYLDMLLWGSVDPASGENVLPPSLLHELQCRRDLDELELLAAAWDQEIELDSELVGVADSLPQLALQPQVSGGAVAAAASGSGSQPAATPLFGSTRATGRRLPGTAGAET